MGAQPDTSTSAPEVWHGVLQILAPIFVPRLLATYLVCAATLGDSTLTAVQIIRVTPQGAKRQDGDTPVKQTFGKLVGAVVRLPARAGTDPTLLAHAEGIEDGLSVSAATGVAVHVHLGAVASVAADRVNLLLEDDDPDAKAAQLAERVEAWTAQGITVIAATPWPERDASK